MEYKSRKIGRADNFGNAMFIEIFSDEKGVDIHGTIMLKLQSENKQRNIGTIYYHDRSFHVTRDSSKHFHYMSKSYGFNWSVLSDQALNIKTISMVVDKTTRYVFPKSVIEQFGKYLNFKQQGFELQRFLPLDIIKSFKDETYTN